jgi:predicted  nucleic acid-binding Zn-ribbon protein
LATSFQNEELKTAQNETRKLRERVLQLETTLASLRGDVTAIFQMLKISQRVPEDAKIDEYVAMVKDLLSTSL